MVIFHSGTTRKFLVSFNTRTEQKIKTAITNIAVIEEKLTSGHLEKLQSPAPHVTFPEPDCRSAAESE